MASARIIFLLLFLNAPQLAIETINIARNLVVFLSAETGHSIIILIAKVEGKNQKPFCMVLGCRFDGNAS
jgi:hypothetical protein